MMRTANDQLSSFQSQQCERALEWAVSIINNARMIKHCWRHCNPAPSMHCHQRRPPRWTDANFQWYSIWVREAWTWLGGRKSIWTVKKLSGEVRAWLSVCSKVQMICIWSSWCHCHPTISASRMVYLSGAGLPRLSWKKAVKWM